MESKTHYRKVFKSDHLGSADLEEYIEEGVKLVFTIKYVKQEYNAKVAGRKIDANIAYFKEDVKPLVLNSTNSKQVSKFAGSKFVEDWKDIPVELYVDSTVKMKGEIVGGVRIKSIQPKLTKPTLSPEHPRWQGAIKAIQEGNTTIEVIKDKFQISKEHENELTKKVA